MPPVEKPKLSMVENAKPPVVKEKPKPQPAQPPPPAQPIQKTFIVQVRRTATLEAGVTVQARDQEEAEKQALESVKKMPFSLKKSGVREEIVITRVEEKTYREGA